MTATGIDADTVKKMGSPDFKAQYEGKKVRVRGKVEPYNKQLEIVVFEPEQLQIVN